jgi:hypothetical protein
MVTLTQNLYLVDEVKLALLTALLKKADLNECHYWLNELSLSLDETEVRKYLQGVYYDFYYMLDSSSLFLSECLDVKTLVEILFQLHATPVVFLLGQMKTERPKIIYINKKGSAVASWLAAIKDERLYPFMRAVNKSQNQHNFDGISYYANKLLMHIGGEEIVKALCTYYKSPFIKKSDLNGIHDDLQYILAVYAKLQFLCKGYKTVKDMRTVESVMDYSIPLSIGAFKLERWQNKEDTCADVNALWKRLMHDPILIAFGLSLSSASSLTDTLFAVANYIKSQLDETEMENFIGVDEENTESMDYYTNIVLEQKEKQRLWLENLNKEYSPNVVRIKEMLPSFACVWLNDVFPDIEPELLCLMQYKMLA